MFVTGCSPLVWSFDDEGSDSGPEASSGAQSDPRDSQVSDASSDVSMDAASGMHDGTGRPQDGRANAFDGFPVVDPCAGEFDCAKLDLHCLVVDGVDVACVPCTDNSACSDKARPICDPQVHRCVACETDTDCPSGDVCVTSALAPSHTCVTSCKVQAGCPLHASYCDPQRLLCVSCEKNSDCDPSQVCDVAAGLCVDCAADSDCPAKLVCDRTMDKCVQCLRNQDCGNHGLCALGGFCVPIGPDE